MPDDGYKRYIYIKTCEINSKCAFMRERQYQWVAGMELWSKNTGCSYWVIKKL